MEAIVLAGGLGTRLKTVISEIPKPMAPIGKQPFLFYIFKWLEKHGINRVVLSVGYKWEIIYNEFNDKFNSMELIYSVENYPLGTGGAIALAMTKLKGEEFFIINGDTYFDLNLSNLMSFHKAGKFDFSVALKPMQNFDRYGTVEINEQNRITSFEEKTQKKEGVINGGIYLANTYIKQYFPIAEKFSFENDFMKNNLDKLKFGGCVSEDYFIDIGIPEDYQKAQKSLIKV